MEKEISYCPEKMQRFVKQDSMLHFVVKDMQSKGHEEEYTLQIVFNSYVVEDTVMRAIYETLGEDEDNE